MSEANRRRLTQVLTLLAEETEEREEEMYIRHQAPNKIGAQAVGEKSFLGCRVTIYPQLPILLLIFLSRIFHNLLGSTCRISLLMV